MWKNQKGFSLVELIIVMALMVVLTGSSVAVVGHIRYANTKKVAEEVDKALSRLRLETMSQEGRQFLYIYRLKDGYYMKQLSEGAATGVGIGPGTYGYNLDSTGTRLCGTNVTFSVGGEMIPENNYICVAYKKNGLFDDKNTSTYDQATKTNSDIVISGSGTYTISLDFETGRHFVE